MIIEIHYLKEGGFFFFSYILEGSHNRKQIILEVKLSSMETQNSTLH